MRILMLYQANAPTLMRWNLFKTYTSVHNISHT